MHILYIQVDNKIAFFFDLTQFEYTDSNSLPNTT